jgi:hypothetical protein
MRSPPGSYPMEPKASAAERRPAGVPAEIVISVPHVEFTEGGSKFDDLSRGEKAALQKIEFMSGRRPQANKASAGIALVRAGWKSKRVDTEFPKQKSGYELGSRITSF